MRLMKKIILIRHGETKANSNKQYQGHMDFPLNENGLGQAKALSDVLGERYKIETIYCSPLIRAKQTANAIANTLNLEPIVLDELKEIDFGKWDGLTYDEIALKYPISDWLVSPEKTDIDGGEKWVDFSTRVDKALKRIAMSEHGVIAIVTHAGVIRNYLSQILNLKGLDVFKYTLSNGSISEVIVYDEELTINLLNDVSHIARANANNNIK